MSNALYSSISLDVESVDFQDTTSILLTNEIRGFDIHQRTAIQDPVLPGTTRKYDVFFGGVTGAGTLEAGLDIIPLLNVDPIAPSVVFTARYAQNRVTPTGIKVKAISETENGINYDFFGLSTGTAGGFGSVTIEVIRVATLQDAADSLNNVINAVANAGAMVGFDIVPRNQAGGSIIYDLFVAYLP